MEGKELYGKYDPYDKSLIQEPEEIASKKDIKKAKKNRSLPERDPKFYRGNARMICEHVRSEAESKIAAIRHAQKTQDKLLEKNASKMLIEILEKEIKDLAERREYKKIKGRIDFIEKIEKRMQELENNGETWSEKERVVSNLRSVVDIINEAGIDRKKIVEDARRTSRQKIDFEKQRYFLRKRKKIAKFFLAQLLDDTEKYLELEKEIGLESSENIQTRKEFLLRGIASTILKTQVFIVSNFCQMGEEYLDEWEYKEICQNENGVIPYFKRSEAKEGIIFPDGVDAKNLGNVSLWIKTMERVNMEEIKAYIFQKDKEAENYYKKIFNRNNTYESKKSK